ncbi:hypothetical protein DPEC_G00331190 [Dallia pectoralis]|uniref:Uncharacterized protein n=1 Tax=Dallia pectoralis TaxID=75939 RepID=A0ACC2F928_DALPE|nr:hypothetical protein DPEC_G00331190 [Dallia pectoralis]
MLEKEAGPSRWYTPKVSSLIPRLTKEDDIEAYLTAFERTARREAWPVAEWAGLIAPQLTGPAQAAYLDLREKGEDYPKLKNEIHLNSREREDGRKSVGPLLLAGSDEGRSKPLETLFEREALDLTMATKGIAKELYLMFSRVGLPSTILTDQGTRNAGDVWKYSREDSSDHTRGERWRRGEEEQPSILKDSRTDNCQPASHDLRTREEGTPMPLPTTLAKKEMRELLRIGLVEPSARSWFGSIVLVPKPDGSVRFFNDFGLLNAISTFDVYPTEMIEQLGKAIFISTLNLTKGYWQVPLAPEVCHMTAFSTPDGLHQYVRSVSSIRVAWSRSHLPVADGHTALLSSGECKGQLQLTVQCHLALDEAEYLEYIISSGLI